MLDPRGSRLPKVIIVISSTCKFQSSFSLTTVYWLWVKTPNSSCHPQKRHQHQPVFESLHDRKHTSRFPNHHHRTLIALVGSCYSPQRRESNGISLKTTPFPVWARSKSQKKVHGQKFCSAWERLLMFGETHIS